MVAGRPGTQYTAGCGVSSTTAVDSGGIPVPGKRRPVILAACACSLARRRAPCTLRPYRQASAIRASTASADAAATEASKIALRYSWGGHGAPVTDWQIVPANLGQPSTAVLTRNATATTADPSALDIATNHTASPSLALTPAAVRRASGADPNQARAVA